MKMSCVLDADEAVRALGGGVMTGMTHPPSQVMVNDF